MVFSFPAIQKGTPSTMTGLYFSSGVFALVSEDRGKRVSTFCVCVYACDTYVVRSRCGCGVDGVDGVGGVAGVDGIGGVDGVDKWVFCGRHCAS